MNEPDDNAADPKLLAIRTAAWEAFSAYGIRKTSMDDIARGAGMSRPALYLRFRNKDEIFRSLVQYYFDTSAEAVAAALARPGPPADVLAAAFEAHGGKLIAEMMASMHGNEMMNAKNTVAADIIATGEARLRRIYADWFAARMAPDDGDDGAPEDMAAAVIGALHGIKQTAPDYPVYLRLIRQLARMIAAPLPARPDGLG
ncbi:MAG: TetR/AcrR family transcriptional regulator [Rhodobacteraceae bacterium]|nr:TetR/AcrR family transcriptional regulator [Paracoccaceae bacterium]